MCLYVICSYRHKTPQRPLELTIRHKLPAGTTANTATQLESRPNYMLIKAIVTVTMDKQTEY